MSLSDLAEIFVKGGLDGHLPEFAYGLIAKLAHTLTGEVELIFYLFERLTLFLPDAEEACYDVGLTLVEGEEEACYLLVETFVEEVGVGVVGESVGEGVDDEATILLGGAWGVGGDGAPG